MKILNACYLTIIVACSSGAYADAYRCAQMVYKGGWFRKYEVKGNTWGANTKKHGVASSSAGSTTETSTASVDPGVSLNRLLSSAQYSSSWGECAAIDMEITQEFRGRYIKQNIAEIKKQIVIGEGYHIEIGSLRNKAESFYDAKDENGFDATLQKIIRDDVNLNAQCKVVG
ncbi:MAG: hypothetical protein NT027_14580 [Proteobacteria bacterium]|nr:hypothetical protein [Pseudomonadota bacterium]